MEEPRKMMRESALGCVGQATSALLATTSSMLTFSHATAITMKQAMAKLGVEGLDRSLTAAMADLDGVLHFADDISPPTEQVQDYLTEVDTRRALFGES